jgi:hypothetical protein
LKSRRERSVRRPTLGAAVPVAKARQVVPIPREKLHSAAGPEKLPKPGSAPYSALSPYLTAVRGFSSSPLLQLKHFVRRNAASAEMPRGRYSNDRATHRPLEKPFSRCFSNGEIGRVIDCDGGAPALGTWASDRPAFAKSDRSLAITGDSSSGLFCDGTKGSPRENGAPLNPWMLRCIYQTRSAAGSSTKWAAGTISKFAGASRSTPPLREPADEYRVRPSAGAKNRMERLGSERRMGCLIGWCRRPS